MQEMKDFVLWFLVQLPDFLLSEPICYLVGFFFLAVVITIFQRLINIHR